jgi:hypothetical protein
MYSALTGSRISPQDLKKYWKRREGQTCPYIPELVQLISSREREVPYYLKFLFYNKNRILLGR